MLRIEALCRRGVAVARHLRRTTLRRFNVTTSSLHDVSALRFHAIAAPQRYVALAPHHSGVIVLHRYSVAQFQICDVATARHLNAVILQCFDAMTSRISDTSVLRLWNIAAL